MIEKLLSFSWLCVITALVLSCFAVAAYNNRFFKSGLLQNSQENHSVVVNRYDQNPSLLLDVGLVGDRIADHLDIATTSLHCLNDKELAELGSLPVLAEPTQLSVISIDRTRECTVRSGDLFVFEPHPDDKLYMFTKDGLVPAGGHSQSPGFAVHVRQGTIWAIVEFGLDAAG